MTTNQLIAKILRKNPEVAKLLKEESIINKILTLIYKLEQSKQVNFPLPYIVFCDVLEETKQQLEKAQNQPIKLS